MAAVAHNPKFAKKVGVPQSVGKEFNDADRKAKGGKVKKTAEAIRRMESAAPHPKLFSTLENLIAEAPFEKAPSSQWEGYLQPGRPFEVEGLSFPLKKEELEYSGASALFDSLRDVDELLSKERLLKRIGDDRLRLQSELRPQDNYQNWSSANVPGAIPGSYETSLTTFPKRFDDLNRTAITLAGYPTHYTPETLSWSRTTRHGVPGKGVVRLIDEIQSDRASAAGERGWHTPEGDWITHGPFSETFFPERLERLGHLMRRGWSPRPGTRFLNRSDYHRIPDAPFKDPADYSRLELKKQVLKALDRGDRYLGTTPSEVQISRYEQAMTPERRAGMEHVYDKIVPGELAKLARQYDIPLTEVELQSSLVRGDPRIPLLAEFDEELPSAFLRESIDVDDDPSFFANNVSELIANYRDVFRGDSVVNSRLTQLERTLNREWKSVHRKAQAIDPEDTRILDALVNENPDIHRSLMELDSINSMALRRRANVLGDKPQKLTALDLDPESESVKRLNRVGIPLWTLPALTGAGALMAPDDEIGYAKGGKVIDMIDALEKVRKRVRGAYRSEERAEVVPLDREERVRQRLTELRREIDRGRMDEAFAADVEPPSDSVWPLRAIEETSPPEAPRQMIDLSGPVVDIDRAKPHLVNQAGEIIKPGSRLKSFRGEDYELVDLQPPHRPGTSGRVIVRRPGSKGSDEAYYPGVFDLQFRMPDAVMRSGILTDEIPPTRKAEGGEVKREPSESLSILNRLVRGLGLPEASDTRARLLSGLASMIYSRDPKTGELSLIPRPTLNLSPEGKLSYGGGLPGLVEDTLALPALYDVFKKEGEEHDAPEWAHAAQERSDQQMSTILEELGLKDPEGFGENFDEALGTMLGQFPLKPRTVGKIARKIGPEARELAGGIAGSPLEYLFPTIEARPQNYLMGAGFGGSLGSIDQWLPAISERLQKLGLVAPDETEGEE